MFFSTHNNIVLLDVFIFIIITIYYYLLVFIIYLILFIHFYQFINFKCICFLFKYILFNCALITESIFIFIYLFWSNVYLSFKVIY